MVADKTMLQFAEDIGSIKKGVDNLEIGQAAQAEAAVEMDEKISGLHKNVAELVTADECAARHESHEELHAEEMTGLMNQPGILERFGKRAKYLLAIGALVTMFGGALVVLYRLAGRVEAKLAEPAKPAQLIYVPQPTPVALPPDASIKPDAKPTPKRRRGARRGR